MHARVAFLVVSFVLVGLGTRPARAGKAVEGAINLNTAPAEVLALLPGIGPSKAQAILAYRKRHPFRTVDELVRIKGIGRKMVRRVRGHLAVGGPTTATARATPPPGTVSTPEVKPVAPPPPRPKVVLACVHPSGKPRPPPRVPRGAGGACWPAP